MPIGGWPKDKLLKEVGLYNWAGCEQGLEGYGLWILSGQLLWSKDEIDVFFAKTLAGDEGPEDSCILSFVSGRILGD